MPGKKNEKWDEAKVDKKRRGWEGRNSILHRAKLGSEKCSFTIQAGERKGAQRKKEKESDTGASTLRRGERAHKTKSIKSFLRGKEINP